MNTIDYNQSTSKTSIFSVLRFEFKLNWTFIKRDIFAIIFPGLLFTTRALTAGSFAWQEWISSIGFSLLYFWLLLTCFCISNQIFGVEEDKLNKPDRPIPSDMVSISSAFIRYIISGILFIALSIYLDVMGFALVAIFSVILHNVFELGHHWLTKNLFVAAGMLSTLGAGWSIVGPLTPAVWFWMIFLAGLWLFLGHVQDFRDVKGDKEVGRVTFPIYFGDQFSRYLLSVCFFLLPAFIHFYVIDPTEINFFVVAWNLVFVIMSWAIAIRLLIIRTAEGDDRTYSVFTQLYCLMIISTFSLLYV